MTVNVKPYRNFSLKKFAGIGLVDPSGGGAHSAIELPDRRRIRLEAVTLVYQAARPSGAAYYRDNLRTSAVRARERPLYKNDRDRRVYLAGLDIVFSRGRCYNGFIS